MAHLLAAKYTPPTSAQPQAKMAIAFFIASNPDHFLIQQMVLKRAGNEATATRPRLDLRKLLPRSGSDSFGPRTCKWRVFDRAFSAFFATWPAAGHARSNPLRSRPVRPRSIHRIQVRGLYSQLRAARLHECNRLQVRADGGIRRRRELDKPSPANPWRGRERDHFSCRP